MKANVTLYTKGHCPYCRRAKALLREKGIEDWTEYDLEVQPGKKGEMLKRAKGGWTVPQIFINDHHVGGAQDLFEFEHSGQLDQLLKPK